MLAHTYLCSSFPPCLECLGRGLNCLLGLTETEVGYLTEFFGSGRVWVNEMSITSSIRVRSDSLVTANFFPSSASTHLPSI